MTRLFTYRGMLNRQPYVDLYNLNNEALNDTKKSCRLQTSLGTSLDLQPIILYLLFWRSYSIEPGDGLGVGISRCFSRLKP